MRISAVRHSMWTIAGSIIVAILIFRGDGEAHWPKYCFITGSTRVRKTLCPASSMPPNEVQLGQRRTTVRRLGVGNDRSISRPSRRYDDRNRWTPTESETCFIDGWPKDGGRH